MIKLGGLVDLKPITEADVFTATSKETGTTSVFKSKAARDAAIKAGTHEKRKDDKDGGVKDPSKKDTPKVNIFNKDKEEPKSEPNSEPSKSYLPYSDDAYNEIEEISSADALLDYAESKEGLSDEQRKKLKDLAADWEDAEGEMMMGGDDDEYEEATSEITAKAMEVVLGPYDTWPEPKQDEPKSEPSQPKLESDPQAEKVADKISKKYGITPQKMGEEDYKVAMGRAVYSALTNSNFHTEARELIAVLEDKPELAKRPEYPSISDPDFDKKMGDIRKKYASTYSERDDYSSALGRETSDAAEWDGVKSVGTLTKQLRDNGMSDFADKIESIFDKKEYMKKEGRISISNLVKENIINEGTRSQVGIIDRSGKIASAYVHYDGYPSNMKPGLKKHMKNEKDVLKLIKSGGARGIYNDKDIEYYKSGKPTKGNLKDFGKYVDAADRNGMAEYVYLYNMKDKKWYFADVYGDKKLKKLF